MRKTAFALTFASLVAFGMVVGFAFLRKEPVQVRLNDERDEIQVAFNDAGQDDAMRVGFVPISDGQILHVQGDIEEGETKIEFSDGSRRITANLREGDERAYDVTSSEGVWQMRAIPSEEGASGRVLIYKTTE